MEPADQRREHRIRREWEDGSGVCRNGARRPAAGALNTFALADIFKLKPQWSPPTSGGSTISAFSLHDDK